jgi:hypothetical protein
VEGVIDNKSVTSHHNSTRIRRERRASYVRQKRPEQEAAETATTLHFDCLDVRRSRVVRLEKRFKAYWELQVEIAKFAYRSPASLVVVQDHNKAFIR